MARDGKMWYDSNRSKAGDENGKMSGISEESGFTMGKQQIEILVFLLLRLRQGKNNVPGSDVRAKENRYLCG